jgi:hypothetical protein
MCQLRFDIWNPETIMDHYKCLQPCRAGRAEMCCPFIGACRNVGSNLGSHLRHDSYREIGEGNASSSGSVGTLNPGLPRRLESQQRKHKQADQAHSAGAFLDWNNLGEVFSGIGERQTTPLIMLYLLLENMTPWQIETLKKGAI